MSEHRKKLVEYLHAIQIFGKTLDVGGKEWTVVSSLKSFDGEYDTLQKEDCDLNLPLPEPHSKYDYIFCCEVMQYVYDPLNVLKNLASFLNTDGHLYLSFYKDFEKFYPRDSDYLRYTSQGVYKLTEMAGLKVIDFQEPIKGYYLVACTK